MRPLSVARAVTGSPGWARALIATIGIATGCRHAEPTEPAEPVESEQFAERHAEPAAIAAERARFDRPAMVRFHMQRHFGDLRMIERRLIDGKLDEATALAHLLARPARDPGFARWQAESRQVTEAALALASATSLEDACRREPRVSAACAACHVRAQAATVFGPPPPLPPDTATNEARMARHLWATDRLWEAMVGGSEPAWRGGLTVIAATPPPVTPIDTSRVARRLQDLAEGQLSGTAAISDRAAVYGDLLVTCVACHATLRPQAR